MFTDLQDGTIQAALTIYPFQGQMLGSGDNDLGNPVETDVHNQPMMDAGWIGYKPWVEKHLTAIKEFDAAQNEALTWLNNPANASAAQAILENDFQIPAFVAKTYLISAYISYGVSTSDLAPWVGPMVSAGLLKKGAIKNVGALVLKKP
jgi:NitT/TauT family transport system substrate-binding protein